MVIPAKRSAEDEPTTNAWTMASDKIIVTYGDIYLKLGKEGFPNFRVLVSSVALTLASPVFDAMFNGNFSEGQARSASLPHEVPLAEDDTQAMLLVDQIAHMRTSHLPEKLTIDAFTDFAFVCDKPSFATSTSAPKPSRHGAKYGSLKSSKVPPEQTSRKSYLQTTC
jgi:hypothetical protein